MLSYLLRLMSLIVVAVIVVIAAAIVHLVIVATLKVKMTRKGETRNTRNDN